MAILKTRASRTASKTILKKSGAALKGYNLAKAQQMLKVTPNFLRNAIEATGIKTVKAGNAVVIPMTGFTRLKKYVAANKAA